MNIIRFDIAVNSIWKQDEKGLFEDLKKRFSSQFGKENYADYNTDVKKQWENIPQNNLKAIFNKNDLVAAGQYDNIKYFLFRTENAPTQILHVTFNVVCLFSNENVTDSLNILSKHLKRVFSNRLNIRIATQTVKRNNIYLYPCGDHDILDNKIMVKGLFHKRQFWDNDQQIIRDGFILVIVAISGVLSIWGELESDLKSMMMGVAGSGIFYVLTEIALRFFDRKLKVVIEDLDSPISGPESPILDEPKLTSPNVK